VTKQIDRAPSFKKVNNRNGNFRLRIPRKIERQETFVQTDLQVQLFHSVVSSLDRYSPERMIDCNQLCSQRHLLLM
jgi:hypothetical protein